MAARDRQLDLDCLFDPPLTIDEATRREMELHALADGTLEGRRRPSVRRRIAADPQAASEVEQLRRLDSLLKSAEPDLDAIDFTDLRQTVMRRVADEHFRTADPLASGNDIGLGAELDADLQAEFAAGLGDPLRVAEAGDDIELGPLLKLAAENSAEDEQDEAIAGKITPAGWVARGVAYARANPGRVLRQASVAAGLVLAAGVGLMALSNSPAEQPSNDPVLIVTPFGKTASMGQIAVVGPTTGGDKAVLSVAGPRTADSYALEDLDPAHREAFQVEAATHALAPLVDQPGRVIVGSAKPR